jgi:hypothetical protein
MQAMTADLEQEFFLRQGIGWLWFGLLTAPLAFLLNLLLSYMLVPWACATSQHVMLHLVPLGALLLAAGGGISAWDNWQRMRQVQPSEAGGVLPRSRFMAVIGLLSSGLFILVIMAQWLPHFILSPCQT